MVRCADGTLYTGWSTDPVAREKAHNQGRGAKYTKSRRPVRLVYLEAAADKNAALSREWAIKKLSRKEKLLLLEEYGPFEMPEI